MGRAWLCLLTGIPALLVFIFVPEGSQGIRILLPLLMILETGFLGQVGQSMIRIRRETGTKVPFRERIKLIPWGAGLLVYGLFHNNEIAGRYVLIIGSLAVLSMTISKVLIIRSPLCPQGLPSL
jgi:hypothetical protein